MVQLLITGGAGFIGSNFIHYIRRKYPSYRIINLDKLTYAGNLENLAGVEKHNYTFHRGDIADAGTVDLIFQKGIDYVINFAAETHVDRSIEGPNAFIRTNIEGTFTLLEATRKHGVKKFLQVSTDEVYGSLGPTGYFTEESPLQPNNPYSASKASADLLTRAYYRTFGLPVNITRCSNNYGPRQHPEKLMPLLITRALRDQQLPIYGDGLYIRDWLHVEDHCRALDLVLHNGAVGEVYNIGGNNELTNMEVVRRILDLLGKPYSLISHVKDRPGHDRRYALDATKIYSHLGWKAQYTFERGLSETIKWYQNKGLP